MITCVARKRLLFWITDNMDLDKDQNLFPNIIHLPVEILVQIFKHVSKYEEIDIIRQVCRRFKSVSEIILKDAFSDIRVSIRNFSTKDMFLLLYTVNYITHRTLGKNVKVVDKHNTHTHTSFINILLLKY